MAFAVADASMCEVVPGKIESCAWGLVQFSMSVIIHNSRVNLRNHGMPRSDLLYLCAVEAVQQSCELDCLEVETSTFSCFVLSMRSCELDPADVMQLVCQLVHFHGHVILTVFIQHIANR